MMPETPQERSEHARKANRARQIQEPSGAAMTAAARAKANDPDRFVRQAREMHPGASEQDIQRVARNLRDEWKAIFSRAGVQARQAKAAARAARAEAAKLARQAEAATRRAERAEQSKAELEELLEELTA